MIPDQAQRAVFLRILQGITERIVQATHLLLNDPDNTAASNALRQARTDLGYFEEKLAALRTHQPPPPQDDHCEGWAIDPAARTITKVLVSAEYPHRHWTNGHGITLAAVFGAQFDNPLYTGDHALYDAALAWFQVDDGQPLRGGGVVVGMERTGSTSEFACDPPSVSLEELQQRIRFLSWPEVLSWFAARSSDPAVHINGRTIMSWGDMLKEIPPPAGGSTP